MKKTLFSLFKVIIVIATVSLAANVKKKKIIIDCDPGGDDALALLVAVKSDSLDIKAITTLSGNAHLKDAIANTVYTLNTAGSASIPIYSGASKPLKRPIVFDHFYGDHGLGGINVQSLLSSTTKKNLKKRMEKEIKTASSGNAVDKMLSIIKNNPNQISIIALGPLTNIALAIKKDPNIMKSVKEIIITGGALKVAGNISKSAEFNFYVDPEAVDIVFNSDIKNKLIISKDAVDETNYTWQELVDDLGEKAILTNPFTLNKETVKNFITRMLDFKNGPTILKAPIFDPLSIYAVTHPISTYNCNVTINTNDEKPRAKSSENCTKQTNVEIVKGISKNQFKKFLLDTLQ